MIAFLRLFVVLGSLLIIGYGFYLLFTNPFPLLDPLFFMGAGSFMFFVTVYRIGEVD